VKPITVISLPSRVPAESWTPRIIKSGTDTSGARPEGSGGKARRIESAETALMLGTLAWGRSAGGVTKISTTTGINSSQTARLEWA
jgi:hypothetical protein